MRTNRFGHTEIDVSLLTFGCGAVGGLMTKGVAADQDRAVAWARDNGINHFDTAPSYGNTASETNLGRALGKSRDDVFVSTKIGLALSDRASLADTVRHSVEASLTRLCQERVDLFQLHNTLGIEKDDQTISVNMVLSEVVPAFMKMRDEGKTRYLGFTAKGETADLHRLIESGSFDGTQIFYNLLVPSAGGPMPAKYPAQDYQELLFAAERHGVGSIGVRVLAGGALSGTSNRHPLGMQSVTPIGSNTDFATDVSRALKFTPLIDADHAKSLPELAVRYAISNPSLCTVEIGIANLEELQKAADAINKGPLTQEALDAIRDIQDSFIGTA